MSFFLVNLCVLRVFVVEFINHKVHKEKNASGFLETLNQKNLQ